MNNRAVLVETVDVLKLIDVPIPKPGPNDVQVQVKNVGICGSDVNYLKKGQCGPFVMTKPMIIGHEASGVITEVGQNVKHLKVGDRVAIEPGESCGTCSFCKQGRYNLCDKMKFAATPPFDGFLQNFICHPAHLCFKLPNDLTLEHGALVEPLAVSIHACKKSEITLGSFVVIIGCGSVGLLASVSAKSFGASAILMMDKLEYKTNAAKELCADFAITINGTESPKEIYDAIVSLLGREPDVIMDCTDSGLCLPLAVTCVREGGSIAIIGMSNQSISLNLSTIAKKEIKIQGIFRYANDYQQAIDAMMNCKDTVTKIITHKFAMDFAKQAFDTFFEIKAKPIKIMFELP